MFVVSISKRTERSISFYGDFAYSVEALDTIDDIEGRSQRIKIPQGNSAGLKLIIERIKR